MPSGRVEAGEESGTALDRELTEELDRDFHVGDLLRVVENFFRLGERDYHELYIIYRITPSNPEVLDTDWTLRRTPPGEEHVLDFRWLPIDDLNHHTLKPEWLISRLSDLPRETTHVIVRE